VAFLAIVPFQRPQKPLSCQTQIWPWLASR